MNLSKNKNDYTSIWWTKISIFSLLQFIMFILLISFAILTAQTFNEFGWGINSPLVDAISPHAQLIRGFLVYTLIFYISISLYIQFRLIPKIKNECFKSIALLGFISWLLVPYFFKRSINNNYFKDYFLYLKLNINPDLNSTVSHNHFFKLFSIRGKKDRLFWNTLLFYFTFLVALISFCFIMIQMPSDPAETSNMFLFAKFGYFTNTTNMICFFILLFMLFSPKNYIFRNNTILIIMSACITIVGLIYWAYLFPIANDFDSRPPAQNARSVWTHTLVPITFIWFSISSFRTNLYNPIKFRTLSLSGYVYPTIYGAIIFILPFFIRFTPYGFITNTNPEMIYFHVVDGILKLEQNGEYWVFSFMFLFVVIFTLFFYFYYFIAKKISQKYSNNIFDISRTVLHTEV